MYPTERKLDGCFFRVERDGKWVNRCFTDLTKEEQEKMLEGRSAEWYRRLLEHLADQLRSVGDELNVVYMYEVIEEEEE